MAVRENYSRKRNAIYQAICSTKSHPNAEWVYEQLKPQFRDLSLGTVYRNLKKFCEDGKAISVGVINGQEHFDADTTPHSHFVCDRCQSISDIYKPFFSEELLKSLNEEYGVSVTSNEVLFHGVCKECLERE
ncbi:MAG: transcriptional repressor [Clostridia bacterium]|nr:transcriptional repressor [Clostridia bacterium]